MVKASKWSQLDYVDSPYKQIGNQMRTVLTSQSSYRWIIAFASAAILVVAMGIMVNGISVFTIPLQAEFGWPRASIALINVSGLIGLAVGGVIMGRLADTSDTRKICLFGSFVLGICMLLSSQAATLWHFYVLFFFAGFLGAGSLFAPLIANTGNWFKTGAGLAVGIVSAGQALGQGGIPFGSSFLISSLGWRGAFIGLGLVTLFFLIPLSFLIHKAPVSAAGASDQNSSLLDQSPVPLPTNLVIAWLSVGVIFCCTCMSVPLMHLVPLIQDRGFSPEDASSVAFLMLIAAIAGRVSFGKLSDIIGAVPAYLAASLWQALLVFFFIKFESLTGFYIYAVIFGFGYAGVMTGLLISVRALTPVSRRASALGIVLVFAWMGHGIGGYQGGFFFDETGDYTRSFANAALAGILNLIIVGSLYFTINRRFLAKSHAV